MSDTPKNLPVAGTIFDPERTFAERGDDGVIRIYDMFTGECVQVIGNKAQIEKIPDAFVEVTRDDGTKVLVSRNSTLDEKDMKARGQALTPLLQDVICSRLANGETLLDICDDPNMPSMHTIGRWRRANKEFDTAMIEALKNHADYSADKALRIVEELNQVPFKSEVEKAKLHTDILKWRAQVHKPHNYSPTVKADMNVTMPVQIIVNTGIRRPGDPGYIVDETAKIREAQKIGTPEEGPANQQEEKSLGRKAVEPQYLEVKSNESE